MNIVLQNTETRHFYAGCDGWVLEPVDALPFGDTRQALQFCRRHHLRNVRLLVFLHGGKVSLLLYVPGAKTPSPDGVLHAAT